MNIIIWSCSCNSHMLHVRDAHTRSDPQRSCVCAYASVDTGMNKRILQEPVGKKWSKHRETVMCYPLWYEVAVVASERYIIQEEIRERCPFFCSLQRIWQKRQANPFDKVRVSHASFGTKYSTQQIDPKLLYLLFALLLAGVDYGEPPWLPPFHSVYSGLPLTEYDMNNWRNPTGTSQPKAEMMMQFLLSDGLVVKN